MPPFSIRFLSPVIRIIPSMTDLCTAFRTRKIDHSNLFLSLENLRLDREIFFLSIFFSETTESRDLPSCNRGRTPPRIDEGATFLPFASLTA